jgi:riboflavin kinase/FMN adenylyltransferase
MQHFRSFDEIRHPIPTVCTIGAFDGVHLGHQRLIHAVVADARACQARAAVVTFFPHPRVVLGKAPARYLTLPDEKAMQIAALGVDILVVLEFTAQMAQMTASAFVRQMVAGLRPLSLWVGPDFALGHCRQGNVAYLAELGRALGFEVRMMDKLSLGEGVISSTRIRAALARGDLSDANRCLGRPFSVVARRCDARMLRVDERQWLPSPGIYPARIAGCVGQVTIPDDHPHHLLLGHPLESYAEQVRVEFV